LIARILGVSLITSGLVAGLGVALVVAASEQVLRVGEAMLVILFFGCVGGVIGAIAGAAREVVSAQRRKPAEWPEIK
jgi:hypothetical protein